jgi:hypothetical protein
LKTGIVTFGFGLPKTVRSNELLAQITKRKSRELCAPIFTQSSSIVVNGQFGVSYMLEEVNKPSPTIDVARCAVGWAKVRGLEKLLVVAAKPHMWRCVRDLKYAAKESAAQVKIERCKEIDTYSEDIWFCNDSSQTRSRSKIKWYIREYLLRCLPIAIYKRIAT